MGGWPRATVRPKDHWPAAIAGRGRCSTGKWQNRAFGIVALIAPRTLFHSQDVKPESIPERAYSGVVWASKSRAVQDGCCVPRVTQGHKPIYQFRQCFHPFRSKTCGPAEGSERSLSVADSQAALAKHAPTSRIERVDARGSSACQPALVRVGVGVGIDGVSIPKASLCVVGPQSHDSGEVPARLPVVSEREFQLAEERVGFGTHGRSRRRRPQAIAAAYTAHSAVRPIRWKSRPFESK